MQAPARTAAKDFFRFGIEGRAPCERQLWRGLRSIAWSSDVR